MVLDPIWNHDAGAHALTLTGIRFLSGEVRRTECPYGDIILQLQGECELTQPVRLAILTVENRHAMQ